MIEGLKLKITSSELKCHLEARAKYHSDRADEYAKDLPTLKEISKRLSEKQQLEPDHITMANKFSNSFTVAGMEQNVTEFEQDIRNHRNKALAFRFYAEHLFSEDYTLQEKDLQRLEVISAY